MSLLLSLRKGLILPALVAVFPISVWSQIAAVPQSNEYVIAGSLAGDQARSSVSINQNGGYLVFEENSSQKNGMQIGGTRLNSAFTKISGFLVNKVTKGDQVKPQVQSLSNGEAIFVWQSYGLGNADIFARISKSDGTFATGDIRVNSDSRAKTSYAKDQQSEPVVCALNDGSALVVWQSLNQDGHMMGIYARKISANGTLGNEVLVNETTSYNQRSPAIATLANGSIIVVWVSELQRFQAQYGSSEDPLLGRDSIDIYGRLFDALGEASPEIGPLNSGNNICANPSVAALPNGGFTLAWSEKDSLSRSNSWEVMGRSFSGEGIATGADFKINTNTYGDQYCPKIAAVGNDCAVVWTSLGQDGSREGIYGRLLQGGTQPSGDEFRVNHSTASKQIFPAIAAVGPDRFLVTWSSFVAITGFDVFGRKYTINQQQ
jgi:hypothetical protein